MCELCSRGFQLIENVLCVCVYVVCVCLSVVLCSADDKRRAYIIIVRVMMDAPIEHLSINTLAVCVVGGAPAQLRCVSVVVVVVCDNEGIYFVRCVCVMRGVMCVVVRAIDLRFAARAHVRNRPNG